MIHWSNAQQMVLKQYWQIIWRRAWIPLLLVGVVAVVSLLTWQTASPTYTSAIRFTIAFVAVEDGVVAVRERLAALLPLFERVHAYLLCFSVPQRSARALMGHAGNPSTRYSPLSTGTRRVDGGMLTSSSCATPPSSVRG